MERYHQFQLVLSYLKEIQTHSLKQRGIEFDESLGQFNQLVILFFCHQGHIRLFGSIFLSVWFLKLVHY